MRPLLSERGCTIPPGIQLRTLAEAIDHLGASGQTRIIDGTENRFRRPAAGRRLVPKAVREADLPVIEAVATLWPQPGGCDLRTIGEQRSDRP